MFLNPDIVGQDLGVGLVYFNLISQLSGREMTHILVNDILLTEKLANAFESEAGKSLLMKFNLRFIASPFNMIISPSGLVRWTVLSNSETGQIPSIEDLRQIFASANQQDRLLKALFKPLQDILKSVGSPERPYIEFPEKNNQCFFCVV